jgi:hypothetical protein
MLIETHHIQSGFYYTYGFIQNDYPRGTQHGTGFGQRFVVQAHVNLIRGKNRDGRTARDYSFQVKTVGNAAAVFIYQFTKRDAQWKFVVAGLVHVAGEAEYLGTGGFFSAYGGVPLAAPVYDMGYIGQGFHVVYYSGSVVQTLYGRERRFYPRMSPAPFQRGQESGFLTADIGSAAAMHDYIDIDTFSK